MPDGGFLVKFISKDREVERCRCYAVSFDYDKWKYSVNNEEEKLLPEPLMKIEVILE